MTAQNIINKKSGINPLSSLLLIGIISLTFIYDNELKAAVISGMNLAAMRIIPTLFPFMILSDYWIASFNISKNSFIGKIFRKAFKINQSLITAFLTGAFAGFPLGVKTAVDLYNEGAITREELERISPIVNLPSLAFVISGVGLGIYNDIMIGILLYSVVLISSIIVAIIQGIGRKYSNYSSVISRQMFDLTNSIRKAGCSSLNICFYIIFFSAVIGLASVIIKNGILLAVISSFFEIGNATSIISNTSFVFRGTRLILTAFALGFSGFSVHLQAFSFMPQDISKIKYLITKLLVGLLSSILITIVMIFLKI